MKGRKKYIVAVLLIAIGFYGFACSPQKSLAHRLKAADHIVVTNSLYDFSISLSRSEVSAIVQAIASGKEAPGLTSGVAFELHFFKGDQRLGTILASDASFGIGDTIYRDDTGTLKALYERFRRDRPPPR